MLQAEQLSYSRNGRMLVDRVDLNLKPGEITMLLGPNGAGKSSLLNLISGMVAPDKGSVTLSGHPVMQLDSQQRAQYLAMYTQQQPLSFPFLAEEVVALGCYPLLLGREGTMQRTGEIMEQLDLTGLVGREYPSLSGGERQRVQLARILAQAGPDCQLLLLDEPLSEMDLKYQQLVLRLLQDVAGRGVAVCCVLHDLNLAAQIADRAVLLRDGRVLASGPRQEVMTEQLLSELYQVPVQKVDNKAQPLFFIGSGGESDSGSD